MRIPARLEPLLDVGIIDEVVRPLMSGKEAAVYLVVARGELRVAKVYKDAQKRSFKHRADYTEGRRGRNSRRQRAIEKRSRYGREELEASWRTAEVDAIRKLRAADVCVPEPFEFYEGVLVMELVEGAPGEPAPRLIDIDLSPREARALHAVLLREIIKMLCAGVVHGDLSDFNVLLRESGPVIIDFPQAVDPAFNRNAEKLFVRDVDNISSFLARWAPELGRKQYGREIWRLYEKGVLDPDTPLTGAVAESTEIADVDAILSEIDDAREEAYRIKGERPPPRRDGRPRRQEPQGRRGEPPPPPASIAAEGAPRRRAVEIFEPPPPKKKGRGRGRGGDGRGRDRDGRGRDGDGRGRDGDGRGRGGDGRGRGGDGRGRGGDGRGRGGDGRGRGGEGRGRDGEGRGRGGEGRSGGRRASGPPRGSSYPSSDSGPPARSSGGPDDGAPRKKRRRRRRRRKPSGPGSSSSSGGQ